MAETEFDLQAEITGLREEVASLKEHLAPKDKEPDTDDEEFKGKTLAEANREALIRVRAHTRARKASSQAASQADAKATPQP